MWMSGCWGQRRASDARRVCHFQGKMALQVLWVRQALGDALSTVAWGRFTSVLSVEVAYFWVARVAIRLI
jgi:hypothetical protein